MPRSVHRAACALLVLALAACDSTSAPEGVAGRYAAYTVNGQRPPVAVWGSMQAGTLQVVDASVRLGDDGNASVEVITRSVAADGTAGTPESRTYTGTYTRNGDLLEMGILRAGEWQVRAEGVVISAREVAVTLHVALSHYTGYYVYPISIIGRR